MKYFIVDKRGRWIGIVETNYAYAVAYWVPLGYRLRARSLAVVNV